MDAVVGHRLARLAILSTAVFLFLSCSGLVTEDPSTADPGSADSGSGDAGPQPDSGDGFPADGAAADGTAAVDGSWPDAAEASEGAQDCDTDEHATSVGCVSCEVAVQLVASTAESLVQNSRTCDNFADCILADVSVLPCYRRCPVPISAKHAATLSSQLDEVAKGEFCFCADKPWDCVDASAQKIGCVGGLCQFLP